MNERKKILLNLIIKEYIKSASPVGSKSLADAGRLEVSSATIRNDMAELENEGYIAQPHTSAGRVPTAKGYKFYLESIQQGKLSAAEEKSLKNILARLKLGNHELLIKILAKAMVEMSKNTVVVGFSENNVYYTGIANLFCQPEFQSPSRIYDISLIIDHLDGVMAKLFHQLNQGVEVKIGVDNPFDRQCSAILTSWGKKKKGIIGLLGPMRMDYEKNLGLINFFKQNI